jgi:hypothetical protein
VNGHEIGAYDNRRDGQGNEQAPGNPVYDYLTCYRIDCDHDYLLDFDFPEDLQSAIALANLTRIAQQSSKIISPKQLASTYLAANNSAAFVIIASCSVSDT